MAAVQLKKVSAQHHALIDYILANSHEKGWATECCKHFGITRSWLSIVMRSDVFQEEFTRRRSYHDQELTRQITAKQTELALAALDRVRDIIDDDECDDRLALDIANSAMKNLGFGPRPGAGPSVEREISRVQTREVAPGVLEQARITYRTVTSGQEPVPALPEE